MKRNIKIEATLKKRDRTQPKAGKLFIQLLAHALVPSTHDLANYR